MAEKRTPRKKSKKQAVWDHMRRNPRFCVRDLIIVTEVSEEFLRSLFWYLEGAGYIRCDNDEKEIYRRQYTLLKNTGVQSPAMINMRLFDYNTKEELVIEKKIRRAVI